MYVTFIKFHKSITFNVNGLHPPNKSQKMAEWVKKHDSIYAAYKKLTLNMKCTLKVKEWKKIYPAY